MRKTKNAFTLIELLAVIVILAIIALIATPIILGIVEDAKKDAFLRSVELVISTTDIDIANKTFEEEYTYTITDGSISNLEVSIKNTSGMNGTIIYDIEGKEVYAIYNGVYCVKKTMNSKAEISDYQEGECVLSGGSGVEVLASIQSQVPNEGDVVTFTNGQLINLGEYGIRYQGNDPDNYVYFNCSNYSNQTSENCELWRIIGVVDGKVKLVKSESIGYMAWDDAGIQGIWDGPEGNDWTTATLKEYLNGEYLTNITNKNSKTNEMISPSTWYLRGHNTTEVTKDTMYNLERTEGEVLHSASQLDNTKIGLMYPSDYGYASMEINDCSSDTNLSDYAEYCINSNWLYNEMENRWQRELLITPYSLEYFDDAIFVINWEGSIDEEHTPAESIGDSPVGGEVSPTIYLSSDVKILGQGTSQQPYMLSK